MLKCDFCTKSNPDGTCHWNMQSDREKDCKIAINKMTTALKTSNINLKK